MYTTYVPKASERAKGRKRTLSVQPLTPKGIDIRRRSSALFSSSAGSFRRRPPGSGDASLQRISGHDDETLSDPKLDDGQDAQPSTRTSDTPSDAKIADGRDAQPSRRTSVTTMTPEELVQTTVQATTFAEAPSTSDDPDTWPMYLLHPHKMPRISWDLFTVLLIMYSVVAIPFTLAFDPPSARGPRGFMFLLDRGIDFTFMLDVGLNFLTAVDDKTDNVLITNLTEIRQRYFRGWFIIDVMSAFPVDLLMNSGQTRDRVKMISMVKSFKIFRLLRVVR